MQWLKYQKDLGTDSKITLTLSSTECNALKYMCILIMNASDYLSCGLQKLRASFTYLTRIEA